MIYVYMYLCVCLLIRFERIFSMFRELRFKHLVFCISFLNRQKQEKKKKKR